MNLGSTSFLDGAPPGPGVYFFQYVQDYNAHQFKDAGGHTIPFPDPNLYVWVSISQMVILFDKDLTWFNAKPAIDLVIPVVSPDLNFGAPGPFPSSNGTGLGDITIGPALQFNMIKNECGDPLFSHRLEAQFIIPTGRYSADHDVNPGSGFFSFDPYWAGTLFLSKKWEVSYRAHYLWNDILDHPNAHLHAHSSQAGEAFHINFATSYELIEKKLRIGFNGYWFDQTTASEVDGVQVPGRERVLAVGPGLMWRLGQDSTLIFNYYFEVDARDRPEGNRVNLLLFHRFKPRTSEK